MGGIPFIVIGRKDKNSRTCVYRPQNVYVLGYHNHIQISNNVIINAAWATVALKISARNSYTIYYDFNVVLNYSCNTIYLVYQVQWIMGTVF